MGDKTSESVSRVLSFKAIICLGVELLQRSSHPSVFCAQLTADKSVLLRVGFTWPHSLLCAGELLPRLSILTDSKNRRRFISVALSLRSPSAVVNRYPAV